MSSSLRTLLFTSLGAAVAMTASGCGGDDDDGGGGQAPSCGTSDDPQIVVLTDVQPAPNSTVPNDAIVHAFTVVDSPGMFQNFNFVLGMLHTAGSPVSGSFQFTITAEGANHRYEAQPVVWSSAPGNVNMVVNDTYQMPDGCVYGLPAPLFNYSVTAGSAGSGGTGGVDSGGGSGGAGGG